MRCKPGIAAAAIVAALVHAPALPAQQPTLPTAPPDTVPVTEPIRPIEAAPVAVAPTPGADTALASPPRWAPLVTARSIAEDRLRLGQLLGTAPHTGFMLRSASTLFDGPPPERGGVAHQLLAPELRLVRNSAIPFSINEGMWMGAGTNLRLTAGVRMQLGPVRVVAAPEVHQQENADFQVIPYQSWREPRRDRLASPWYGAPHSMDLPTRPGETSRKEVVPGQSSLAVELGPLLAGVATENLWWGPAVQNAIVMSGNAQGFPHLFLRTDRAIRTRWGNVEGMWLLGELAESGYFDFDPGNDARSLSALALTFTPALEPGLTLGLTRAVYAQARGGVGVGAAFDVFRLVGQPSAQLGDTLVTETHRRDQIFSLFGRWVFPDAGFEAYGEWARFEEARSIRDFLTDPDHSQGYTLGLQWARPFGDGSAWRIQGEATNLELSASYATRPTLSTYASRAVPQGYTHRGQVIGAATGPGSSSQWGATDYVASRWQAGVFGGRIRWNNAAFYSQAPNPTMYSHDVSVYGGVRAGYALDRWMVLAELAAAQRINYQFQTFFKGAGRNPESVNVRNNTLRITVGRY